MSVMIGWIAFAIGLIIGSLAVGVPFWFTHRRLGPHHNPGEAHDYLNATGKTPQDAAEGRLGRASRRQGTPGEQAEAVYAAADQSEREPGTENPQP